MAKDFEKKARDILDILNKKIDELLERHDISKEDIKKEIDVRVEELKKTKATIEKELKEFGEDNRENFERIERAIGGAAREIGEAFKDMFKSSGPPEKDGEKHPNT